MMLLPFSLAGALSADQWNAVVDGGFEDGAPTSDWNEMPSGIIVYDPTFAYDNSTYVAAMGMTSAPTSPLSYSLSQNITMGTGDSTLQFWLRWESTSENDQDYIMVKLDDALIFSLDASQGTAAGQTYQLVSRNLGQYPDGQEHTLSFEVYLAGTSNTGFGTLFYIDDVEVITENAVEALTPEFTWTPSEPTAGQECRFTDSTTGMPDSWSWDFGDGTTSDQQNPRHTYTDPGGYTVMLTVIRGSDNAEESLQKNITVLEILAPEFSWTGNTEPGEEIIFNDNSLGNPDLWSWDFGDGTTSEQRNPAHTYTAPGRYTVSLEVTRSIDNSHGSVQHELFVGYELFAEFSWDPLDPMPGDNVSFTDQSTGTPDSWSWDFGDGSSSDIQQPHHVFEEPGPHTVVLSIERSSDGTATQVTHTIQVREPLFAEFSWDPLDPMPGDNVSFTDQSTGTPDSWSWDFGDGSSSNEQNPFHSFNAIGNYNVVLTVSYGPDSVSVHHMLHVSEVPVADFSWSPENPREGDEVVFTNTSTGQLHSSSWNFGDGASSDETNPVHIFEAAGSYEVRLTVVFDDPDGGSTQTMTSHTVTVDEAGTLQVDFDWNPSEPQPGENVLFNAVSQEEITDWNWDFGDGSTASGNTVNHVFEDAGSYLVTLEVSDSAGLTAEVSHSVEVSAGDQGADFSWDPELPRPGEDVHFTDLSTGSPESWSWDFGDDRQSNQANPIHRFMMEGSYQVSLNVTYGDGNTRSVSHILNVSRNGLKAEYYWMPLLPSTGETVEFHENCRGDIGNFFWDFGDGESSSEQNPGHVFRSAGDYQVSLSVGTGTDQPFSDTVTHTVRVSDPVEIDFNWEPEEPRAQENVHFHGEIPGDVAAIFWNFGDGGTSRQSEPLHIFRSSGKFTVQLLALNAEGQALASVEHVVTIGPPELELELEVSDTQPEIGETIHFRIDTGTKTIPVPDAVRWNFGGPACDDVPRILDCVPSENDSCLEKSFTYSSPGLKGVRVTLEIGGNLLAPIGAGIRVQSGGQCGQAPRAAFSWWPAEVMQGQRVRMVDQSGGEPLNWRWSFDDGSDSTRQHPVKVFETPGDHEIILEVSNDSGSSSLTKTITITPLTDAECGNGICEPGETRWNCPADCGGAEANATGRNGRKNTGFAIPAAAGGIPGHNGTHWFTDGNITNPGEDEASVIIQFFPDRNPGTSLSVGPAILPPHSAIHFDNIVTELFGVQQLGGIWIDADQPVIVNTRTYNQTDEGTLGQAIGGISKQDLIGENTGGVYLLGLSQNTDFRTNLLLEEVTGQDIVIDAVIYNASGEAVARAVFPLDGGTRWQHGLPDLGINELENGYAHVSVEGEGWVAVLASKVDQRSGDATTIDPIHYQQMDFGSPAKTGTDEEHFLVAVVARNAGLNDTLWRSELSVLNPESESQTIELRYIPSEGEIQSLSFDLGPGEVFATPDILADYFPSVGNDKGALHVYSDKALAVSSRTYNLLPTDATVGQSIPGLAEGDMVHPGEVWLLDSLRDDEDYRCNVGFAEYEGNDTEVTLVLFDTSAMSQRYLGYQVYTVPAYSQLQINRVFRSFGIEGDVPQAMAYISISSEKGAVYSYASIVDNAIGDGTTILAKRQ